MALLAAQSLAGSTICLLVSRWAGVPVSNSFSAKLKQLPNTYGCPLSKAHPQRKEIKAAGQAMEIKITPAEVRTSADIGPAYEALSASGAEVVVVEQSNMLINARSQIAEIAAARMLPTVYGYREHVEAGGLISYGVNLDWCFHRTAYYVDKILKGAKPSELPVELPTNLQMVINLKTAKALKLDIPRALLDRADEVIE